MNQHGMRAEHVHMELQELASEGLVSSTRGRGTFVSAHVRPAAQSPGFRAAINDRLEMPANGSIKVLSRTFSKDLPNHFVPAGAEKYPEYAVLEKVHALDREPFSYIRVMVARPIYEKFPKGADQKFKVLKLILDQGRMKLRRSFLQIVVVYADDHLANLLQCAPLSALVRIRTSRVDTRNRVALCSDSYYRADKFIYEVEEEGIDLGHTSGLALPATIPSKFNGAL